MTPKHVVVLLNAGAGSIDNGAHDKLRDQLQSAFEKHAIETSLEFAPGADLEAAALRALERVKRGELDAVAAGGGDGTISAVAGALAGSDVVLGVIPLGTLNHFAKDLKIPLSIDDAVAVIASGAVRQVDVGEVNGKVFINNSSIGVYPYLVLDRERRRRSSGLSKPVAMALAALRALRNLPLRRLLIQAEGWTEPCRSPLIFVGNNDYGLAGTALGARDRLDDGLLSLYVARKQSALALSWLALRTVLGFRTPQRDLRIEQVSTLTISSHHKHRLLVAYDGEIEIMALPLVYRSRPGALRVFAPGTAPA